MAVSWGKSLPNPSGLRKAGKSEGNLPIPSTTESHTTKRQSTQSHAFFGSTTPRQPKEKSAPQTKVLDTSASDHGKAMGSNTVTFPVPLMPPDISDKGPIFPNIPPPWVASQLLPGEMTSPLPNTPQAPMPVGNMLDPRATVDNVLQDLGAVWNTVRNPIDGRSLPVGSLEEPRGLTPRRLPSMLNVGLGTTTQIPSEWIAKEPPALDTKDSVPQKEKSFVIELTPDMKLDRLEIKANKILLHGM